MIEQPKVVPASMRAPAEFEVGLSAGSMAPRADLNSLDLRAAHIARLVGADACSIFEASESADMGDFFLVGTDGWESESPHHHDRKFTPDGGSGSGPRTGFTRYVAGTGRPLNVPDIHKPAHDGDIEVRRADVVHYELPEVACMAIVPIVITSDDSNEHRVHGIIRVLRRPSPEWQPFDAADMEVLRKEADIRSLLLWQRIRQRTIVACLAAAANADDEDAFAQTVLSAARALVPGKVNEYRILLSDSPTSTEYRQRAPAELDQRPVPADKGLTRLVIRRRAALLSLDITSDLRTAGSPFHNCPLDEPDRAPRSCSFIGVPIFSDPDDKNSRVEGVIKVTSTGRNAFFEHDRAALLDLARVAGQLLQTKRKQQVLAASYHALLGAEERAVVGIDASGRVDVFNAGATALLQFSQEISNQKRDVTRVLYGGKKALADDVDRRLKAHSNCVATVYRKDGVPVPVRISADRLALNGRYAAQMFILTPLVPMKLLPKAVECGPDGETTVDAAFHEVIAVAARNVRTSHFAPSVLILGERGSGKEVMARLLHVERSKFLAGKANRPVGEFVSRDLAVIPRELIGSELFGILPNTATGVAGQYGCFELADKGTLFLDEIGTLPPEIQPKLLRVLQERKIRRFGENIPDSKLKLIDVLVIGATNEIDRISDPERFRQDLLARLRVKLDIPPLRKRRSDILLLADRYLGRLKADANSEDQKAWPEGFSGDVVEDLMYYTWPDNIRELENVIHAALVAFQMRGGGEGSRLIERRDLPQAIVEAADERIGSEEGGSVASESLSRRIAELEARVAQLERPLHNVSPDPVPVPKPLAEWLADVIDDQAHPAWGPVANWWNGGAQAMDGSAQPVLDAYERAIGSRVAKSTLSEARKAVKKLRSQTKAARDAT